MVPDTKFVPLLVLLAIGMGCSPESVENNQFGKQVAGNQELVKDVPKDPEPSAFADKLNQVEKLLQSNQLDAAWSMAKELIVEQPNSPKATFLAARILAQRKNLNGAIQMISKIDPNDPEAGLAAVGQLQNGLLYMAISQKQKSRQNRFCLFIQLPFPRCDCSWIFFMRRVDDGRPHASSNDSCDSGTSLPPI